MARNQAAPGEGQIKVRVLTDCVYGQANDVVALDRATAEQAKTDGLVDDNAQAVAYAEGLPGAIEAAPGA